MVLSQTCWKNDDNVNLRLGVSGIDGCLALIFVMMRSGGVLEGA